MQRRGRHPCKQDIRGARRRKESSGVARVAFNLLADQRHLNTITWEEVCAHWLGGSSKSGKDKSTVYFIWLKIGRSGID